MLLKYLFNKNPPNPLKHRDSRIFYYKKGDEYRMLAKKSCSKINCFLKFSVIVFVIILFNGGFCNASNTEFESFKIGDYIQFGNYLKEPILWRIIAIKDNKPILFSDRIIAIKAFDLYGNKNQYIELDRTDHGSNYWPNSTLRTWLNSVAKEGKVFENHPISISSGTIYGVNDNIYDQEAGFLKDFSSEELELLEKRNYKVLLANPYNIEEIKDGGSEPHKYNKDIEDVVQNYDVANYQNVTDTVFLLSVKELKEYVFDNNIELKSTPTKVAIENSTYKGDGSFGWLEPSNYISYWTRTPLVITEDEVRNISKYEGETVSSIYASNGRYGVRPAVQLMADIKPLVGRGTYNTPYILANGKEQSISELKNELATKISITIDDIKVEFNEDLGYPFIDSNNRTQVPFRVTMEAIGASVEWDPVNRIAIATKGNITVKVPIDKDFIYRNGEIIQNDTFSIISNARTYLPIRIVFEAFGKKVRWDGDTKTVIINTPIENPSEEGFLKEIIYFEDADFEAFIRNHIGKYSGDILRKDIYSIAQLEISGDYNKGIKSIHDIREFANLEILKIEGTRIEDIKPLIYLKNLKSLEINHIMAKDFSPLAELTQLEELYLTCPNDNITFLNQLKNLKILCLKGDPENLEPLANLTNLEGLLIYSSIYSNIDELNNPYYVENYKLSPLQNLKKLKTLILFSNVKDLTPLSELKELNALQICSKLISDISPIENLTDLKVLSLEHPRAQDWTINSLSVFKNFCENPEIPIISPMDGFNEIYKKEDAIDLSYLNKLNNLTQLKIIKGSISNLESISNLTNLELLELYSNNIDDIQPVANLTKLKDLRLDINNIKNIEALSNLIELEGLILRNNDIEDITPLANLSKLEVLDLRHNLRISDISPLQNLHNLQQLDIGDTSVTDINPLSNLTKLIVLIQQ